MRAGVMRSSLDTFSAGGKTVRDQMMSTSPSLRKYTNFGCGANHMAGWRNRFAGGVCGIGGGWVGADAKEWGGQHLYIRLILSTEDVFRRKCHFLCSCASALVCVCVCVGAHVFR